MENPVSKAANVERYNRTLKTRLYKYFTLNKTNKWLMILPKIVTAINNSINRMHGMKPSDVTHDNDQIVYDRLYKTNSIKRKRKFAIGDLVRITKEKGVFEKAYLPTRTSEVFVISKILKRNPIAYKLKDLNNEDLTSIFYTEELVLVRK